MDGRRELLLFNTTRAHTPEDPQAQEPQSKEGAAAVQHNARAKQASKQARRVQHGQRTLRLGLGVSALSKAVNPDTETRFEARRWTLDRCAGPGARGGLRLGAAAASRLPGEPIEIAVSSTRPRSRESVIFNGRDKGDNARKCIVRQGAISNPGPHF